MITKSLYTESIIIDYENGEQSLERDFIVYENSIRDIYHTVKLEEDILSISYKYYSNHVAWYLIADTNPLIDIFDIPMGTVLVIPNPNKINI